MRRHALMIFACAGLGPFASAQSPDERIWCHDSERNIVTQTERWRCKFDVVSNDQAEAIKAERIKRIQRVLNREKNPVVPGRRMTGAGSGFFISKSGDVLTNFHVVKGCGSVTVVPAEGTRPAGERVARKGFGDPRNDLAIIKTDFKVARPARFSASEDPLPRPGASVSVVGYPSLGRVVIKPKMVKGEVRLATPVSRTGIISMKIDIRSGNSGGPVLDAAGRAIGVVVAKVNTPGVYAKTGQLVRDIGFAIPLGPVKKFTEHNRIKLLYSDDHEGVSDEARFSRARDFVVQVRCWGKR